ncbi:MAG: carbohydrate deacetylase [Thermoanaerobaculia bacterium]
MAEGGPAAGAGQRILIVNADDLGRTEGINEGIFASHERGLVTSATLMVACPAAEAGVARLARFPRLGVGLHVQLTGGRPLAPPDRIPSLVDSDGRLPRWPEGLRDARGEEILAELHLQLARFRALTGRDPTHLDSHHHSHRLPQVLAEVMEIARREGLPVRNAGPEVAESLRRAGLRTPDVFVERFFGDEVRPEVLREVLEGLEPGVTELMCHPGLADEGLRAESSYAEARERELALLTRADMLRMVEERGIRMAHFGTAFGTASGMASTTA